MFFTRSYSDNKVLELLSSGERSESKAIEFLLHENRAKISALVLKAGGSKHDAESILIEGVTSFVFNVRNGKFKKDSKISTYLYAICQRIWLKSQQKEKRYTDFEETHSETENDDSPFAAYSDAQLKDDVFFLLKQLGEACQTVLTMWAGHYSMTEIADTLHYKNAQIAMNKKNKCMKKLKEITASNAGLREQLTHYLY